MINWVEKVDSDSTKIHNKLIECVNQLLQQLFLNSETNQSLRETFKELTNICQILVREDRYDRLLVFDILLIILKDYIKLLDQDQFIRMIDEENLSFLRQLYQVIKMKYTGKCENLEDLPEKTAREIFFSLFDRINQSKRFLLYLENQLVEKNDTFIHCYHMTFYLILKIFNQLLIFPMRGYLEKCPKNLLQLFIRLIDQYFLQKRNSRHENLLMKELLKFLLNMTRFLFIAPLFVQINYPEKCLHWLTFDYLNPDEHVPVIQMIYFLSMHDDGIRALRAVHGDRILRDYQTKQLNTKVNFLTNPKWSRHVSEVLTFSLVSLIDFDETNRKILDEFFSTTISALEQRDHDEDSLSIERRLVPLMKLCTTDDLLDYFFHETSNVIPFFNTLKILLNDLEKKILKSSAAALAILALANLLWSLSFHEQYHKCFSSYHFLLKKLEDCHQNGVLENFLSVIYIPSQMFSLSRTIDGIQYNLNPSRMETKSSAETCSIMISYSNANLTFARELTEILLQVPELKIHVNFLDGKYLWEEVRQTINQSNVILFLLSDDFYIDKSSRQEFLHVTDRAKKLFFPIFINDSYKPQGWIQKRIARLKSVRFSSREHFLDHCEELFGLINENLSMNITWKRSSSSAEILQWNERDIEEWFTRDKLSRELYEFYHFENGKQLLLYAQATLAYPWTKEYERIQGRFHLSSEEFLKFIYALKRLPK